MRAAARLTPSCTSEDFRGLSHLAARLGDDLVVGIVLYTGQQTLPFGPRFRAIPIGALWEGVAQ